MECKKVILYASYHHKNTEKVVLGIYQDINADIINLYDNPNPDIEAYSTIILASGVYFNKLHKRILDLIDRTDFKDKKVIILYTCGFPYMNYAKKPSRSIIEKGATYLGRAYSRGYDTCGILKKIGGIARKHPSTMDIDKIKVKLNKIINEAR